MRERADTTTVAAVVTASTATAERWRFNAAWGEWRRACISPGKHQGRHAVVA